MKKKSVKNTKNCRKMPNTTTFWVFWSKIQIQIITNLKLTVLVLLWRACYREKAKKKSHAQKYYHLKIQRLGPREFEFSRSKFFLVKTKKNSSKPSRTKQNRSSSQSLYIIITIGQYSRYSFASKRLFFFPENV